MPILALQSPFLGVETSVGNSLVRRFMPLKVERVLKVQLKFRGSKSGRPTDDLL